MNQDRINTFMISNQKYFPADKIPIIVEKLKALPEDKETMLYAADLKDPTTMLIVSLFAGWLGIDRFMLGETGMGVLKLLTGGLCGILTIIDWFLIMKKTKETNFKNIALLI